MHSTVRRRRWRNGSQKYFILPDDSVWLPAPMIPSIAASPQAAVNPSVFRLAVIMINMCPPDLVFLFQ